MGPIDRFLHVEAASGIILLVAAAVALIWANSPLREWYGELWHTSLAIRVGPISFERDLHFWINDGLMTIFFFVAGVEIRREMNRGALSDLRRAALPLAAAVGGMLAPACIFALLNRGRPSAVGWGVPMATDIAFAVGVLTLLGKRVPPPLRILLLALAVIDDVGAIVVIAFFYSSGLSPFGFVIVAAGLSTIVLMQALGLRSPWAYVVPGVIVWVGAYRAGIHPALAGVAVGLMTPVRAWLGPEVFLRTARESIAALGDQVRHDERAVMLHLQQFHQVGREAVAPIDRIEHALHRLVAFGIMPLFALANAGVPLGALSFEGDSLYLFLGVTIGLVVGKPIGIVALSWLSVRLGVASLPTGTTWPQVTLVGVVGGIGFTMALFVAQLAFPNEGQLETAKMGILLASAVAAGLAYGVGRLLLPSKVNDGGP